MTSPEDTGFPIISCVNLNTGLVVRTALSSAERSFPAMEAYVGAKFSRSRDGMVQLASEINIAYKDGRLTPDRRLGNIVTGLKHQSPGGMAHIVLAMEQMPILTAATVFREGPPIHDGQEASTRFIDFSSGNGLPDLITLLPSRATVSESVKYEYLELQNMSLSLYQGWFSKVKEALGHHFKIDLNNKKEEEALVARSYDTVRGFLLSGMKTSMVYVTNATSVQQLLANLGADRLPGEKDLAETTLALLAPQESVDGYWPEIKPLLNYVEPNLRTRKEQIKLKDFFEKQPGFCDLLRKRRQFSGIVNNSCDLISGDISAGDKVIAQEVLTIYPSLRLKDILEYAKNLSDDQKVEVGKIIFSDRNRFYLPAIPSATGTTSLLMGLDLGIERDLGRHRAWVRISPVHGTYVGLGELEETGFTQTAYLREIPEFRDISSGMEKDMLAYYDKRRNFIDKLEMAVGKMAAERVGVYLLPLAHHVDMVMHGDARYSVHLMDTRIREGTHIDVRRLMAQANRQIADSHPLYSSLLYPDKRVLVNDRAQFIDRS